MIFLKSSKHYLFCYQLKMKSKEFNVFKLMMCNKHLSKVNSIFWKKNFKTKYINIFKDTYFDPLF